jgi:DNA-binding Lrp family transcriptional regulator
MDEIDRKILELLKSDGRRTYVDIGRKLELSEGAIRKRVQNLLGSGTIKRFTIEMGSGQEATAISLLSISTSVPTPSIVEGLKKLPNVQKVYEVTGQYDVVVIVSATKMAEVNRCLEQIRRFRGVTDTNTMIVLNES